MNIFYFHFEDDFEKGKKCAIFHLFTCGLLVQMEVK